MFAPSLGAEVFMKKKNNQKLGTSGKYKVNVEMNQQRHRISATGHQGLFSIKPVHI